MMGVAGIGNSPSALSSVNPALTTAERANFSNTSSTLARIVIRKPPSTESSLQSSTYYAYRHAYATANYATHVRLISRDFPWSVDIKTQYGTPVTCEDIWNAVYSALQQPLADSEWGMIVGDKDRARKIERAAKKRQEIDKGKKLKRLDWLGDAYLFRGLEKDDEFSKRRTAYAEEECPETVIVKMAAS